MQPAASYEELFSEVADLSSFLFERRKLPALPMEIREALRFKS